MKRLAALALLAGLTLTGCSPAPVITTETDVTVLKPGEVAVVNGVTVMVSGDGSQVAENKAKSAKLVSQFDFSYPGSELGVSGTGWRAGGQITVSLWDAQGKKRLSDRTEATVDADGSFSVVHQLGKLAPGPYTIKAGQSGPADAASVKVEIRKP